MSEIDFKEIEKAMAELVNKAQGKRREQQLGKVVKKRDEIAKKVETARGQGTVATKRIIIGNSRLRAPDSVVRPRSVTAPINANKNPINDFRPRSDLTELAPPPLPTKTYQDELAKANPEATVGDLSNQYIQEQVAQDQSEEQMQIGSDENYVSEEQDVPQEESLAIEESNSNDEVEATEEVVNTEEPEIQTLAEANDDLPESEELANSLQDPTYDYGAVHRIYGQRLPRKFADSNSYQNSKESKSMMFLNDNQKSVHRGKSTKLKSKRGFLFYFVYFLFVASFLTWAAAAYLYFVY